MSIPNNTPRKPKRPLFSNAPQEGSDVAEFTRNIPAPGTPPRSPASHNPITPPASPRGTVNRNTRSAERTLPGNIPVNAVPVSSVLDTSKNLGPIIRLIEYENILKRLDKINCSIQKLELNMKLVKDEDINADEYTNLEKICTNGDLSTVDEETINVESDISNFIKEIKEKKYMNKISSLLKLLSFIFPSLSIVNAGLLKQVKLLDITPKRLKIAARICDGVISSVSGLLDNSDSLESAIDFIIKGDDVGVVEKITTSISSSISSISKTISIKAIGSIKNTEVISIFSSKNKASLKTFFVFLSLLSTFILCRVLLDETSIDESQEYFKEFISVASTNITSITNGVGGGGKKNYSKTKSTKSKVIKSKTPTKPTKTHKVAQKKKK